MPINIKFDLAGHPEPPTIILATRSGRKLGQLDVDQSSISLSDKLNNASEITFTLNKYINEKITNLWDKVVDFKLVYCKEWDMWFEIKVELDEATETVKTVFCTQLGQAELSQVILYNVEINTEADIERDDYKISILYDEKNPEASILNRILDKAPHYSIVHVDPTIAKIQRSFSFDDKSVYDAFNEIAEEIGCLFIYNSNSDEHGKIQRTISVFDLQQNCNDCDYRGEFTDKCPKCGSTNISNGYGDDTLIFVTSDELASNGIQLTTDADSVKNCFKLEAGDDLMTATVRNCNPNGTDYIWYFSDLAKDDMSVELVDKLESYDNMYRQYYEEHVSELDSGLLNKYNSIVDKYLGYNKDLQKITTPIIGYSALMNAYYNVVDLSLYLESGLMPSVEMSKTNAEEQANLLTPYSLSPVAVADVEITSLATVNSAVLAMAKTIVKSAFKVELNDSELSANKKVWTGSFTITNYSDEEDVAVSDIIRVDVNDNNETFIKQKIERLLNKENKDDLSITGLFEKEYDDFCKELKKYALNPLVSFYDACQACIDILIEQGVGDDTSWSDTSSGSDGNLYEKLYTPYYNKLIAIESEIAIRENEINSVAGVYDLNGDLITEGLQTDIEKIKSEIQKVLNFQDYLGNDLWLEFCAYRREDKFSNDNYISDGLNNSELFKRALEFFDIAEKEIFKSSELQHSISTTLNNLLAIPKFKVLVDSFNVGNWIRVRVDDSIFKLRLLEYEIDYNDFDNIPVEFSDIIKIKNGITDVQSILSQASSMASSYDSVKRQASQGNDAQDTIEQWFTNGFNSALIQIQSNDSEDITLTKNGLLCRSYDDISETYSPEQFRLTHNIMAYTTDNWKTVSAALGKHEHSYYDSDKILKQGVGYGLSAKFVTAGYINGSQIIGGEIYSQNYTSTTGTYLDLNSGNFSWAGGKIRYDGQDLKLKDVNLLWDDIEGADSRVTQITKDTVTTSYVNALNVKAGSVDAENITGTTISGKTISGGTISGNTISGNDIVGGTLNINNKFIVTSGGIMTAIDGDFTGKITASGGEVGGWTIGTNKIYAGDSSTGVCVIQKPTSSTTTVFAAGGKSHNNYSDCPFLVTKAGKLYATGAVIRSGSFDSLTAGQTSFTETIVKINANGQGLVVIGDPDYTDDVKGKWVDITIRPQGNEIGNIGTPNHQWDIVRAAGGTISSSDRNKKQDIANMGDIQERLFNALKPVTFKFIKNSSGRTHYGFISQDVEDALIGMGLTGADFAGFCKDSYIDENDEVITTYSLRYDEFIALNTHMIQKLQLENNKLKERIDSLESKLKQLL